MAHYVFGVRHHGPGSARSLVDALEKLAPDIVLVEGPPDADELLAHAARDDITPPVALLVHEEDAPQNAVFYPFALFSPEWQAIRYALKNAIAVRFMDLPQALRMQPLQAAVSDAPAAGEAEGAEPPIDTESEDRTLDPGAQHLPLDPLQALADAAGYSDGERWWDHVVESRGGAADVFAAVNDAMASLREAHPVTDPLELHREAYMRQSIRTAAKAGFERVAVVCGAWHAPALQVLPPAAQDQALLRGLEKIKTRAAWVPWSYDRLAYRSGYGAGVDSPEWYHLLWEHKRAPIVHWMIRAARLLRTQDLEASSASVIEAVRLAEQLAFLRVRELPGLDELLEAVLTVLCNGHRPRLELIVRHLAVGTRLGHIPEDMPATPLMRDLQAQAKRLRLPVSADFKDYDLDLRKETDLARSHLLHRLTVLGISWGEQPRTHVKSRGTFRELWRLTWKPEFAVNLVDASRFGGSVEQAATGKLIEQVLALKSVEEISTRLQQALLAELPQAVEQLLRCLADQAALARDVAQLLRALNPLAEARRYGSVRQTDVGVLDSILEALVARIVIGLPLACGSLDDDAAKQMQQTVLASDKALAVLEQPAWRDAWRSALAALADQDGLHGLIAGATARLLHDAGVADAQTSARRMSVALSKAADPSAAAYWIEGFLSGGAQALLLDETLLPLIDRWLCALSADHFVEALPLLRRGFASFHAAERRQLGEQVKRGAHASAPRAEHAFDRERAALVLPVLRAIFSAGGAGVSS